MKDISSTENIRCGVTSYDKILEVIVRIYAISLTYQLDIFYETIHFIFIIKFHY